MRRVYKTLCLATVSASIMAANMWKNSLKNVESVNNKILYETLLDFFFYSETVLTFCISLVYSATPKNMASFNVPTYGYMLFQGRFLPFYT